MDERQTALLDKSLLEAICAEPEHQQTVLITQLQQKYELVIPTILMEEVWTNLYFPESKDPNLILSMVRMLQHLSAGWIEDELEIVFRELVLRETADRFHPPSQHTVQWFWSCGPKNDKLRDWLKTTKEQSDSIIRQRIIDQDSLRPKGGFYIVQSESELFTRYVRDKLTRKFATPECIQGFLEDFFGSRFRSRHPDKSDAIDKAFQDYNEDTFTQYPMTCLNILAAMFYFYAPLVHVKPLGGQKRRILGKSFHDQRSNLNDERYVTVGLGCQRVLTCDNGMASILNIFKQSGFWHNGESILLSPCRSLAEQIPSELR